MTLGSTCPPRRFSPGLDRSRAARLVVRANALLLAVALLWVVVAARKLGGIAGMVALVQLDAYEAREHLLDNALFTGMRLFYAALPATGTLAAVLLAMPGRAALAPGLRRSLAISYAVTLVALVLLPIVMSQRLLLLQLLVSTFVAVSSLRGRIAGMRFLPLLLGIFFLTWVLREGVTQSDGHGPVLAVAGSKLLFYFSNDLLNSALPFSRPFEHTLGYYSLRFLLAFTLTDGAAGALLADRLLVVDTLRGGGAWSMLTMPYVDFGVFGGALVLVGVGVLTTLSYRRSSESVLGAAIYGQVAGGFVLSTHTFYFANENFIAMIGLTALLVRLSRQGGARRLRGSGPVRLPMRTSVIARAR